MVVIGDSLAVGMAPALQGLLPGRPVLVDARMGRPLDEGMAVLGEPSRRRRRSPTAFSPTTTRSGSNSSTPRCARASRPWPHGCAVWATIVRPNVGGRSYAGVNARLRALALDPALSGRLLIADWAAAVHGHRKAWLAKDKVHATTAGYLARAQLYADALNSCTA